MGRYDEDGFEKKETALEKYDEDSLLIVVCIPKKQILYKPESGGYGIYLCDMCIQGLDDDFPEDFMVTGNFISELDIGQTYEVEGVVAFVRGKKQLKMKAIKKVKPINKMGIVSLLKQLPEIRHYAHLVYDEFGNESISKILNEPDEVVKLCPVFYPELIERWQAFLSDIRDDQGIMIELMTYGLKTTQAKSLYDTYKEKVIQLIRQNPYFLAKEVRGYSFKKCDNIAKMIGFDPKSPLRIHEGIMEVLNNCSLDGHTYLPRPIFIDKCIDLLSVKMSVLEMKAALKNRQPDDAFCKFTFGNLTYKVPIYEVVACMRAYEAARSKREKDQAHVVVIGFSKEDIEKELRIMELEHRIVIEKDAIYSKRMYECETQVAYNISQIIKHEKRLNVNITKELDNYLLANNISLEAKQKEAVLTAAGSIGGFTIIDGSAGCGKTFSLKIALDLMKMQYIKANGFFEVLVLAPTGKAARVATKATGLQAYTIHRALGGSPSTGFFYNSKNQLPYDCIVVDESSMIDIEVAKALFEAVSPLTKVIFLGDTKQLPSVGAGNVLRDLIDSKCVNIVTLNVVKRQGKDSGTLKNANLIIQKQMITSQKESEDAIVISGDGDIDVREKVLKITDKLVSRYGLTEVQVLCPQKNGVNGTNSMNYLLQEKFNPKNEDFMFLNKVIAYTDRFGNNQKVPLNFKKGDKVIHMKNNYTMPWYQLKDGKLFLDKSGYGVTNGECGVILKMDKIQEKEAYVERIFVKYDDKFVIYLDDFSDLDHAYAMTIHKSQGSEWKAVVMPIVSSNRIMLDNNLIYTGYTRTKTFSAVVAEEQALRYAISTVKSIVRYTGLKDRLISFSPRL